MGKNKIAIVVSYFGILPNYFSLWGRSCSFNPTIDFYIFTDQHIENLPVNIQCVSMTILEMKRRASNILGFNAVLDSPYKCCDYKPLYGEIFKDYLSEYDYWGHCDIDLIFGDLQYFFNKYKLYDYDKFGTLGHLSLFRNITSVNNSFKLGTDILDYREVYKSNRSFAFDELGGVSQIMLREGFNVFCKRIFIDIATTNHRYKIIEVYNLDEPPINYETQTFSWENGKTYHIYEKDNSICKEEYLYVHFQKRPNFTSNLPSTIDRFLITNTGFHQITSIITSDLILRYNPYFGYFYELIERQYKLIKRRIKDFVKRRLNR